MKARGWQQPAAEARVFGTWEAVVGADLAAHCRPVKLEDGELTVEAESTAWATQLRLLAARSCSSGSPARSAANVVTQAARPRPGSRRRGARARGGCAAAAARHVRD